MKGSVTRKLGKYAALVAIALAAMMLLASCASGTSAASSSASGSSESASASASSASSESASASASSASAEASASSESVSASASSASAEASSAAAVDQRRVYVDANWVKSVIDGTQAGYEKAIIAEVVYAPEADATADGYIPGAIRVFDVDVEDAEGTKEAPYNLLAASEVEAKMLAHGITKDTPVILYGADPAGVGRVAYAYLWAGVENVKILNGGLAAWTAAGYDVEKDLASETAATDFGTTVPAHPEYWVSMADAKDRLANDANFKLVSIRAEEEWLGKTSGYDYIPKAGEPEGAVWGKGAKSAADVADFTNEDGTVKELDGLKEVWADCDFTLDNHLSFYCGTGWRATVPFLVLYQEGNDNISIYDGGWYEWQMYDENPVQVGDPASSDCKHVTVADLSDDMAAKK